jgi:hypothetical protein
LMIDQVETIVTLRIASRAQHAHQALHGDHAAGASCGMRPL